MKIHKINGQKIESRELTEVIAKPEHAEAIAKLQEQIKKKCLNR